MLQRVTTFVKKWVPVSLGICMMLGIYCVSWVIKKKFFGGNLGGDRVKKLDSCFESVYLGLSWELGRM